MNNEKAIIYRKLNDIPHNWATTINIIVSMVFCIMGDTSSTGVTTVEKIFNRKYLINSQDNDVVAGIRTLQQISKAGKEDLHSIFTINGRIYA